MKRKKQKPEKIRIFTDKPVDPKDAQRFNDLLTELRASRIHNALLWLSNKPRIFFSDKRYIFASLANGFTYAQPGSQAHRALQALGYLKKAIHRSIFFYQAPLEKLPL